MQFPGYVIIEGVGIAIAPFNSIKKGCSRSSVKSSNGIGSLMRYACCRVRMATQGGLEVICTQKVTIAVVNTAKRGPRETKTINVNYASAFT